VIGYALLLLVAEAAKVTGEGTVAPFAGELMLMAPVVAALPTMMLMLLVYALPVESQATMVTLWLPEGSARAVFRLGEPTVYMLLLST
jgi:hypothetical protein